MEPARSAPPVETGAAPVALHPLTGAEADYLESVVERLFGLLLEVVRARCPGIEGVLLGRDSAGEENLLDALQAQGIWLHLLRIAEDISEARLRRRIESLGGPDSVVGSLDWTLAEAAAAGVEPNRIQDLLDRTLISPVITAHPTEAKRVTVLEIHRRIYRHLVELERRRWTPRERAEITEALKDEIDLLWLTGEIRLEKPAVSQEVAWGLHFFHETLFDAVPNTLASLERALARHYPDHRFSLSSLLRFGSWIGGDRDGNPFVTNEVTREALRAGRDAAFEHYRGEVLELIRVLSPALRATKVPDNFLAALARRLRESGQGDVIAARNPGEVFRQYLECLRVSLDATLEEPGAARCPIYRDPDTLVTDLSILGAGLRGAGCGSLARTKVEPLRRKVEAFGFHTTSLDLRQNTTVTNRALADLARHLRSPGEALEPGSKAWSRWLRAELARPLEAPLDTTVLANETREILGLLELAADTRRRLGPRAIGNFVLSMTHSADDLLGVYVLAKHAGLFLDREGRECCVLPIVPLFETIGDLQRAPEIMQELLAQPLVQRSVRFAAGCRRP